jgi:ketosteroid isomerase-like protein
VAVESLVPSGNLPRVSQDSVDLVLRGFRAFLAGDLGTVCELLDPAIEWHGIGSDSVPVQRDQVEQILAQRLAEGYRIELERCIGKGEEVLMAFRAAGVEKDTTDDRPLQTRRYFTIGRYWAIATVRNGRVVRVRDFPRLSAAFEAFGAEGEAG